MSKNTKRMEIPADMWLHVATDALARYAEGGGQIEVFDTRDEDTGQPGLFVLIRNLSTSDPRLAPAFVSQLVEEQISAAEQGESCNSMTPA